MNSKRLFILMTFLLLVMWVVMDQKEAFELRPPRRKRRRCVRRLKRFSKRMSKRETKADVIKPLDLNDAWKILVGENDVLF